MSKNNNFTMIHIAAALFVIIGHQYILLGMAPPSVLGGVQLHGLGVRILFLVSGYLVSLSYIRNQNRISYLWKRVSRLYPSLCVCLLITVLLCRIITENSEYYWQTALKYFLYNIEMRPKFDLAGVFTENIYPYAVNGSLWTLPIELACYIFLILIVDIFNLIKKRNQGIAVFFLVLLLITFSFMDTYRELKCSSNLAVVWGTNWLNAISLFIWFMLGIIYNLLNLKKYCNLQIALLVTFIYICVSEPLHTFFLPYVASYTVMSFALEEKPLFAKTIKRDICYGLYLYAFPIQQLLIYILYVRYGIKCSVYMYIIIAVAFTWGLAELSYKLIETPSAKLIYDVDQTILKCLKRESNRNQNQSASKK